MYNASNASAIFTVSKKDSEVTVEPADIKVGANETIKFTVTEGATGNVTITIADADGKVVKTLEGVAIAEGAEGVKVADLAAGTYNVTVSYGGDSMYDASEASKTFTVSKSDVKVEVLTDVTGKQGDVVQVTIKVTDSETGEPVNGGTVEYTIDFTNKLGLAASITLSATVGEDGTATVDVELSGEPGTYAAKATYSGNEKYNAWLADNPHADKAECKKMRGKCQTWARNDLGLKKYRVDFTDKEWEAVQNNAISPTMFRELLANADMDKVTQRAMPKVQKGLSANSKSRIKAMARSGYTQEEIADSLGLSTSTINDVLNS
jgi:hypothetical protein